MPRLVLFTEKKSDSRKNILARSEGRSAVLVEVFQDVANASIMLVRRGSIQSRKQAVHDKLLHSVTL